jgi:hypothetical protein
MNQNQAEAPVFSTTTVRTAVIGLLCLSLAGCIVAPRVREPRGEIVFAMREPPPERIEVIPAPPGGEHVWLKGHWVWRRDDYEWIPGRWARLEPGFREWVPGRWEHEQRGWLYVEGHWAEVVYATRQPPPVRVEVMTRAPGPEHVWVVGHWDWRRDDFEWVPGHWVRPEPGFHSWVVGRWEHEPKGWFYIEGHWR